VFAPVTAALRAGGPLRVKAQQVSFAQRNRQWAAYELAAYASPRGPEMLRFRFDEVKDDLHANFELSRSSNHGETWSEPEPWPSEWKSPGGTYRRFFVVPPYCDPRTGRLLLLSEGGLLPRDTAGDLYAHFSMSYQTSADQGRTWAEPRPVVEAGKEFSPGHPLPGVWVGKNAAGPTDVVGRRDGAVLVPVQMSVLGEDGALFLPGGASHVHGVRRAHRQVARRRAAGLGARRPRKAGPRAVEPRCLRAGGGRLPGRPSADGRARQ
jgi:hypothetical protein